MYIYAGFPTGKVNALVYCDRKAQRICWSKGTSLERVESSYVKSTETACVSDELYRLLKKMDKS